MSLKVAIAQMQSGEDVWSNLLQFSALLEEACDLRADLVCFPENTFYRGPKSRRPSEAILKFDSRGHFLPYSDFSQELEDIFHQSPVAISVGSVLEESQDLERPYNTHLWWDSDRKTFSRYRKIHLFGFKSEKAEARYSEDQSITPGNQIVSVEWRGLKVGLSICYDLRFAELYRALTFLRQTDVLFVPSAFTHETGEAHWHALLRTRAIENLSYVVASAQAGTHRGEKDEVLRCYGHSIAIDPWGRVLAEADENSTGVLMYELDRAEIEKRRAQLPSLSSALFDSNLRPKFLS